MITMGTDIKKFSCGCVEEGWKRIGENKYFEISYPCGACQEKMIGQRVNVVRYGAIPANGKSYNYRDNKYEAGVSCYLEGQNTRPEFTEGRKAIKFSAIIIGWGGDDEPCIDAKTII